MLFRSWAFLEPVDTVKLGIPHYHTIIPKKDARDLKTIRGKLDADKYESVDAFEADLDLMIQNAITFNGLESEVGLWAVGLQNKYRDLLSPPRTTASTKRKAGDKGTPQPTKKAKTG